MNNALYILVCFDRIISINISLSLSIFLTYLHIKSKQGNISFLTNADTIGLLQVILHSTVLKVRCISDKSDILLSYRQAYTNKI